MMVRRSNAVRVGWRSVLLLAFVPVAVAVPSSTVQAATIDVTTTDDVVDALDGLTSLREAINQASGSTTDIVSIPAGTYELDCPVPEEQNNSSGDLDIVNKDIVLRGPVSGTATIRPAAGCQERVIEIIDFSAPANSVTIERLTITGGRPSGSGGGINAAFSQPTALTILDSVITDNRAGDAGASTAPSGGGVYLYAGGSLVVERSTISENLVGLGGDIGTGSVRGWGAGGGGIAFRSGASIPDPGPVTITDSTISNNVGGIASGGGGGGLWLQSDVITLTDVDVVDNSTPADPSGRAPGFGAGVAIDVLSLLVDMDVDIVRGTISGNTIGRPATNAATGSSVDGGDGGGLWMASRVSGFEMTGSIVINGTMFDGNQAGDGAVQAGGSGGGGRGGGIFIESSTTSSVDPLAVALTDVTISNGRAGDGSQAGRAGGNGGGGYIATSNFNLGGSVTVANSTVSGNRAGHAETVGEGGRGGGLVIESTSANTAGSITVSGSTFTNNRSGNGADGTMGEAAGSGGAASFRVVGTPSSSTPEVTVSSSTFTGNIAGDGGAGSPGAGSFGGFGGAFDVSSTRASVSDSTFTDNRSGDGGAGSSGGQAGRGGAIRFVTTEAEVTGSTFTGNSTGEGGAATGGGSGGPGGGGGAIMFDTLEAVSVTSSTFTNNRTGAGGDGVSGGGTGGRGGAVFVDNEGGTTIDVTDSTFSTNSTGAGGDASAGPGGPGGPGGGLAVRAGGEATTITLDDIDVTGNATGDAGDGVGTMGRLGGSGGGVYVFADHPSSSLGVRSSVITDNATGDGGSASGGGNIAASSGQGGGLYAWVSDLSAGAGDNGTITLDTSSITGNRTGNGGSGLSGASAGRGGSGGGAWLQGGIGSGGLVSIANTTVANNVTGTRPDGTGSGDGGGVQVNDGNIAEFIHTTITGNDGGSGANLLSDTNSTRFTANVVGEPGSSDNCRLVPPTVVTSFGYNVETDRDSCQFTDSTDLVDLDGSVLGPLADNGGVGLSRLPRVTGLLPLPVLDRIPPGNCTSSLDQLGTTRPVGSGCDVGAVEAVLVAPAAVDDVLRAGGGDTVLDVLANDDLQGFTPDDIVLSITSKRSGDDISVEDGSVRFRSPASTGAFTSFTYEACLGNSDQFCDAAEVTLIPDVASRFVPLSPARLFDTRQGQPGAGPKGFVGAGRTIDVQVTGVGGVPTSGVSAVAMNVTATEAAGPGFVTAWASGTQQPLASNLNLTAPGDTIPNFVIVPVGANGKVSLFSQSGTHLLADVAGYFTEGGISLNATSPGASAGRLIPLPPARVFDTRQGEAPPGPKGFVSGGSTIDVQVGGVGGVPNTGVAAVVMNLTATASDGPGFVTAFPTGTDRPTASNLNLGAPGQTTPNLVIVPLGDGGKISLFSLGGVHLLGDVTGYITDTSAPRSLSGLFAPARPSRVFDTRPSEDPPGSKGFLGAGDERAVRFTANVAVPANDVAAVMINLTATEAAAPGFVTAWPDGDSRPLASTLNLTFAGQTRPNAAILPIGDGNRIRFFTQGGAHLLGDVAGWFLE